MLPSEPIAEKFENGALLIDDHSVRLLGLLFNDDDGHAIWAAEGTHFIAPKVMSRRVGTRTLNRINTSPANFHSLIANWNEEFGHPGESLILFLF